MNLTQFLAKSPHIGNYIRYLKLYPDLESVVFVQQLGALLRLLPRLDTLAISRLSIKFDATQLREMLSSFHLVELKISISAWHSSTTSSPLHDLFNLFSSIQTLTVHSCHFGTKEVIPLDKKVAVTRVNFNPGQDEEGEDPMDGPLPTIFRDIVDLSSFKTFGSYLEAQPNLEYIADFIDRTFTSADNPLHVRFVFSAVSVSAIYPSSYLFSCPPEAIGLPSDDETFREYLPLTHAITSATLILELSGEDDEDVMFLGIISEKLTKAPPNIRWLSLEVEIDTWYPLISERVEILKQLEWSTFGHCMKRWTTLEHIQIMVRVRKEEEDGGLTELRQDILRGMGGVKDIVKIVSFI